MNNGKYWIGLFQEEGLLVKGDWVIRISKNENSVYKRLDYNLKTKELKMSKKEKAESAFLSVSNLKIESNCVIDISNDGMRWEGSCLNHSPFGYGSLYNNSNELVYRGVMVRDKKECFGIDYYPDLGQVEYVGCYWNNERHGFGMLYDRQGNLVYEGAFICGSSDFENSVILRDIDDDRMVHSLIHELVIDEGCGNEMNDDLELCGFKNLESIIVKKDSLMNLDSLKISDNPVLKSIETEDADNPVLEMFETENGDGAFYYVKSVTIISTLIVT